MVEFGAGSAAKARILLRAAREVSAYVPVDISGEFLSAQADGLRKHQSERARYEAELRRRRFLKCNPEHRLVADALEADWNDALSRLEALQQEHEGQRPADQGLLNEDARARILALSRDFPRVWNDPRIEARERKRMLGLLIEDVTPSRARRSASTCVSAADKRHR